MVSYTPLGLGINLGFAKSIVFLEYCFCYYIGVESSALARGHLLSGEDILAKFDSTQADLTIPWALATLYEIWFISSRPYSSKHSPQPVP